MQNADYWIQRLNLQKHREGGYFIRKYQSPIILVEDFLPKEYSGARYCSTAIYFLLPGSEVSVFHRLLSDEIWFFHAGSSATIHLIDSDGYFLTKKIGLNLEENEDPMVHIPANSWFAAEVNNPDEYTLVSCTVSPGFEYSDFELAKRIDLLKSYPNYTEIIQRFTVE